MDCSLCGRKIKSETSIGLGYGPVCYAKVFGKAPKRKKEKTSSSSSADDFPYYDIPGQICLEEYLNSLN